MRVTTSSTRSTSPGFEAVSAMKLSRSSISGLLKQVLTSWPDVWAACVRRTHAWRTPPRWCLLDWLEEIDAESVASAYQAIQIFDPARGPTLESFLYHRIVAGALARYRKEWSYALRCTRPPAPGTNESDTDEIDELDAAAAYEKRLNHSMTRLPETDRRLIVCLFWEGRSEKDVAGGLGITQQAVNKRKRKILERLRINIGKVL
jgi:RNA polymerase sigma factor (sigma-70 family)